MTNRVTGPYSPDRVSITLDTASFLGQSIDIPGLPAGLTLPHAVDGRGTDTFLEVAREVPSRSKVTGVDGEVAPVTSLNKSGTFTVTVLQTSITNQIFSAILAAQESGLNFYFPVFVIDLNSQGSIYEANQCWIQGWPTATFGAARSVNAWVIEAGLLRMNHGASSS